MSARGWIVAIEHYSEAEDLAPDLEGTHAAARGFWRWLVESKKVPPGDVYVCTDDPEFPGPGVDRQGLPIFSPSSSGVSKALRRLVDSAAGRTAELYVFFSGHGFRLVDGFVDLGVDVLITGDYANRRDSGRECLKLDQLQNDLRRWLGEGRHFYFVDACRNEARSSDVTPEGLGFQRPPARNGRAKVSTLASTREGAIARVDSGFATHLLEGLAGGGRAKAWWRGELWVDFDSLHRFVRDRLDGVQQVPPPRREGDGRIHRVEPIPENTWTLVVENATSDDEFDLVVRDERDHRIDLGEHGRFRGTETEVRMRPGDYLASVSHRKSRVEGEDPSSYADLYQSEWTSRFRKLEPTQQQVDGQTADVGPLQGGEPEQDVGPTGLESLGTGSEAAELRDELMRRFLGHGLGGALGGAMAEAFGPMLEAGRELEAVSRTQTTVEVRITPGFHPRIRNVQTGELLEAPDLVPDTPIELAPGDYLVDARDDGGRLWERRHVVLEAGEERIVDLTTTSASDHPVVTVLRERFGLHDGRIDFSERLGPMAAEDLGLWLSILGASRIVDEPMGFSKMAPMPLATFEEVPSGQSVVYLLLAVAGAEDGAHWSVSSARPEWVEAPAVEGVPGLNHAQATVEPGSWVVQGRVGSRPPIALATHTLPDHATLVVATDAHGPLQVYQYLLPLHHRLDTLPPALRVRRWPNVLAGVRLSAAAQRSFARQEPIAVEGDVGPWRALVEGSWLDPITAALLAYESLRQGHDTKAAELARRLQENYPTFPDTAVLAHQVDLPGPTVPEGAPLVHDGLFVLEGPPLPLPATHLDYSTPWTLWLGVT